MKKTTRLPTFVIIGAGRCGTTSLYHYLRQHPDVFMSPVKETNFFAPDESRETPRSLDEYASLFSEAGSRQVLGEASPRYLHHPEAAENIRAAIPDAGLIAMFRDPIDRAFSSHLAYRRDGTDARTFVEAVRDEIAGRVPASPDGRWWIVRTGLYFENMLRFLQRFRRDQILMVLQDDLRNETLATLRRVFSFVGADPGFKPDVTIRYNKSGLPKIAALHRIADRKRFTSAVKSMLPRPLYRMAMKVVSGNIERPPVPPDAFQLLADFYREDLLRFEDLIGRDLSAWPALRRKPPPAGEPIPAPA